MTHRGTVSMVNADDNIEDILRFVLGSPHTRHPVFSGKPDNIIGVLHVKDLLRALGEAESLGQKPLLPQLVQNIASDAYFIPETTLLFDQLQAFRTRREHFAVVVDEYGDFRGIVTLEDILEEIVGDIDDEHDIGLAGLSAQADGSWLIDGNVTIRDLNRALGWHLPDEDASTLAGLVLFESRTIPSPGQEFRFHDIRFRIVKREGNRLTSLRLWAS
jgi:Mg2+/Co2+ transporter CorB